MGRLHRGRPLWIGNYLRIGVPRKFDKLDNFVLFDIFDIIF